MVKNFFTENDAMSKVCERYYSKPEIETGYVQEYRVYCIGSQCMSWVKLDGKDNLGRCGKVLLPNELF